MEQPKFYGLTSHDLLRVGTILLLGVISYLATALIGLLPQFHFVQDPQINGLIVSTLTSLLYAVKRATEPVQK